MTSTPTNDAYEEDANITDFAAWFPKVTWAKAFADALPAWGGGKLTDIRREGKTVSFTGPSSFLLDLLEFAGYHSAPNLLARINGYRAIPCY